MIPGITTKLSEDTVASATTMVVRTDLVRVTGSTSVTNILAQFGGGFSGICFLVPVDGAITLNTGGNIIKSVILPQNQVTVMVYSKKFGVWYPGAIS